MEQDTTEVDRRTWLLTQLDKALLRRVVLRQRYALLADLHHTNGDDNAAAFAGQTLQEGYTLNEKIGDLIRSLLEIPPQL